MASATETDKQLDSPPVVEDEGMGINSMGAQMQLKEQAAEQLDGHTITSELPRTPTPPSYSVFKPWQLWTIVGLSSFAALFSPLSANIYFPAIPVIAAAFSQPVENINITVTVYMILQGTAPMLWGSLADWEKCGRRPVYLACLGVLCLSCVGLALIPTKDYWLLVFLRCIQAAGSASSVAVSVGTIMDVAPPSKRGTMLAVATIAVSVAPCIGPVFGGLLAGNLGWRSIFWFLCIASGVALLMEFLFLPETLRAIVGDGSVPPQKWNRPVVPVLLKGVGDEGKSPEPMRGASNPLEVVKMLRNVDLCLVLWSNAVPYAVTYAILTTTSPTFLSVNPSLTEIDLGLCYLPIGFGGILGTIISGKLVDLDFRSAKKAAFLQQGMGEEEAKERAKDTRGQGKYEGIDSIERTRLRKSPWYWAPFVVLTIGYGWAAQQKVSIACLLVLQFLAIFDVSAIFTMHQTLLMDLFPGRGASVTASNNLVRCICGAVIVLVIDYIINALGVGWTFTILGVWCVVTYPMVAMDMAWGRRWRERRVEREKREQEKREMKRHGSQV